jgi:hypothetical protein
VYWLEAARLDKVRHQPWVPTFVGTSGVRAAPSRDAAMRTTCCLIETVLA